MLKNTKRSHSQLVNSFVALRSWCFPEYGHWCIFFAIARKRDHWSAGEMLLLGLCLMWSFVGIFRLLSWGFFLVHFMNNFNSFCMLARRLKTNYIEVNFFFNLIDTTEVLEKCNYVKKIFEVKTFLNMYFKEYWCFYKFLNLT